MNKLRLNFVQVFMLLFCLSISLVSCSIDEKLPETDKEQSVVFNDETLSVRDAIFNITNEESDIVINEVKDGVISNELQKYLSSKKVINSYIGNTALVSFGDNNVAVSTITYTEEQINGKVTEELTKQIIHMTDDYNLDIITEIDLELIDEDENKYKIVSSRILAGGQTNCYGNYSVACADADGDGAVSYFECFGACVTYGADIQGISGVVITVGGGLSAFCPPCGFVASAMLGLVVLGCLGC